MQHLPLFADLKNRAVLVVGGGVVAERRVSLLLEARAPSPSLAPELRRAPHRARGRGRHYPRRAGLRRRLARARIWLVVAATRRPRRQFGCRRRGRGRETLLQRRRRSGALHASSCRRSSIARPSRSRSAAAACRPCSRAGSRASSRPSCRRGSARWPSSRAAGGRACARQVADVAERRAFLGARRDGRRRRACVRGPRRRGRDGALAERALELGQRRRCPARRSVSRRRGPRRHRPDHDPRPPIARDRRRRALRPARERRALAVRAPRRRAHLRRQDAAPAVDLAKAVQSPAREPRASRASASAGSKAAIRSSSAAAARSSRRSRKPASSSKSCPAYPRPKAAPRMPASR